ncbi:MAG TPA: proline dehydrogenase family protein [Gemmatimonadaceae bacterium]|nr:proline dehydrogenase family protein [Gemmatimonadaceae bacterium]
MLRSALLYLSNQPRVFRFVRHNRLARAFARRFVAGETLSDALEAVRRLNAKGIAASLDELGESVNSERAARATRDAYLETLDRIAAEQLDANVSVKLTALGLDVSEALCVSLMQDLLDHARRLGTFVRIDMEASNYVDVTLRLFEERFYPSYRDYVGIVLQSYLYRTWGDVQRALALNCRVRLCKGAYKEPATVAFPDKADVDTNYVKCLHALLSSGRYPGIATHDPALVAETKRYAKERGIASARFEFQMLYGVRRDLQETLVREGWRMRVYVPFGTQWYPYLMRRLAERPANVAFMTGNIVREALSRRRS